ncbi:hypothetical protein [Pontibacter chitinilyticus]
MDAGSGAAVAGQKYKNLVVMPHEKQKAPLPEQGGFPVEIHPLF